MSQILRVLSNLLSSEEAKNLRDDAERFAAKRIDSAVEALVGAAERAYDRRGFRFCEMFLRAQYHRAHWAGLAAASESRKEKARAVRKAKAWGRRADRRKARCISAPPVRIGEEWFSPCAVMKACGYDLDG